MPVDGMAFSLNIENPSNRPTITGLGDSDRELLGIMEKKVTTFGP
jgi:hypothetical protein